jgi:hypothetical protein
MSIATASKNKYISFILQLIFLFSLVHSNFAYSQGRSRENNTQNQNQNHVGPITADYVQKILEQLKSPPALSKEASSAEIKLQLKNLNDRNRNCKTIWLSNKPDVRISEWSLEQRQNFVETCKDTESKLNEFKNWTSNNLLEIEKNENKLAQDKKDENIKQFLAIQPDFILLANSKHPDLLITKKLNGSFAIESKVKGPLNVEFNNATNKNYAYSTRFFSLNQFVLIEIGDRVNEIASTYGVKSQLLFEKKPAFFIQEGKEDNLKFFKHSPFFLIDKLELDKIQNFIQRGDIINLGVISSGDVFKNAKIAQDKSEKKSLDEKNQQTEIVNKIKINPNEVSALFIDVQQNTRQLCSIQKNNVNDTLTVRGYRLLKEFSSSLGIAQEDKFNVMASNLEEIYKNIQTKKCDIVILENKEMVTLVNSLESDKTKFKLFPSKNTTELMLSFVIFQGYKDIEQYNFGNQISANANGVNQLSDFGITNLGQYKLTSKQMNDAGYNPGSSVVAVLEYLKDLAEGKKVGKTAVQIRDIKQAQIVQAAKEREIKLIKELPKYRVAAGCISPADRYVETLMNILASAPGQFINAITAQSKFCQVMNESINDVSLIKEAQLVGRGSDGSEYYVARRNAQAMIGIVKRP